MQNNNAQTQWQQYCDAERRALEPLLQSHHITLDADQPHLKGERYLMQAVTTTSGKKLILLGKKADQQPVVIKATRDTQGQNEIYHERRCREFLKKIDFAASVFATPSEELFLAADGFVISVQTFIAQPKTFLERPIEEQFTYALAAFKAQEGSHATTAKHRALISGTYPLRTSADYLNQMRQYELNVTAQSETTKTLADRLAIATRTLHDNQQTIEQYCGFLTHTDFVPHNFRIDMAGTMYLLDHSSLTFGNKYEGWARFINFMTLYHSELAVALIQYVHNNRTPEESIALRLMRIYRLGEIIWYYQNTIPQSTGNLLLLNQARIEFWSDILGYVLNDTPVPTERITTYQNLRDQLRSDEEKARQKGLH